MTQTELIVKKIKRVDLQAALKSMQDGYIYLTIDKHSKFISLKDSHGVYSFQDIN